MIAKLKLLYAKFVVWLSQVAVKILLSLIWTIAMFVLGDLVGFKGLLKLIVK
jgi:hypothetical protein